MPSPGSLILYTSLALASLGPAGAVYGKPGDPPLMPPPPTAESDPELFRIRRDLDELDKLLPRKLREGGRALHEAFEYPDYRREIQVRFSAISNALWDYELRHPEDVPWLETYKSIFSLRLSLVTGVLKERQHDFHLNALFSRLGAEVLEVPPRRLGDSTLHFFTQHPLATQKEYWEQAAHYLATQDFHVVGNAPGDFTRNAAGGAAEVAKEKPAHQVLAEVSTAIKALGRDYEKHEVPRAVMEMIKSHDQFLVLRSYLATRTESRHVADWPRFAELLQTVKDERSSRLVSTLLVNRGWVLDDMIKISKDAAARGLYTALREAPHRDGNLRQRVVESLHLFYPNEFPDAFTCGAAYARVKPARLPPSTKSQLQ